ncbi:MAG: tetratricopeptide repeat protein [Streptosporangiales bacterium]|nr:tetratricopeptide repeat protein [Streptosporangiales bacterium]
MLARFLRALGMDGAAIPDTLDERAELYRDRVAGRRLLVVLDNAEGEAQVRPLLPGSPSCAVLVTSRTPLTALGGTHTVNLDVFTPEQGVDLLAGIAGRTRVDAEPEAARRMVELCGYLPLAVRIAGARLAAHPHRRLTRLVGRLADERGRLDELVAGDLEVRASLAVGYHALGADERRAFRLLSLLETPDFAAWAVGPLLEVADEYAEDLVDALARARLLDYAGTDGAGRTRYRFHDLVRAYARERAREEDPGPARRDAVGRVFAAYLTLAADADGRLPVQIGAPIRGGAPPSPLDPALHDALLADPCAWFDAERAALVGAVVQACDLGDAALAWQLAASLDNFFDFRNLVDEWRLTHERALGACRTAGDRLGEAVTLRGLAALNGLDTSLVHAERALVLFRELGEPRGEADALYRCADAHRARGRHEEAERRAQASLRAARAAGYRIGQARAWQQIGRLRREGGRLDEAADCFARHLALVRAAGKRRDEAWGLTFLGAVCSDQGDLDRAEGHLLAALPIARAMHETWLQSAVLVNLGELYARQARPEARATLEQAREVFPGSPFPFPPTRALMALGELDRIEGRHDQAITRLGQALYTWRTLRVPFWEARTFARLGDAHRDAGDPVAAVDAWQQACDLYRQIGNTATADAIRARIDAV